MKLAKSIFNSAFLRQNAILFLGSMLVGVGNYIYYPILGRLMTPSSYGEVQTLVALFTQLGITFIVLGQVTVNIIANYGDEEKKQLVIFELEKFTFMLSLALSLVLMAFSWKLKAFFQLSSIWPFSLLLAALVLNVPGAYRIAYLRAHKKFGTTSVALLIGSFGKVILSAVLVYAGFKSVGAIGGIVIAQLIMFAYAAYSAKKLGFFRPQSTHYFKRPRLDAIVPELKYALLVLVGSGAVTLLTSIDLLVAKHYFSPHVAGLYAGISAAAKIIFFVTGSFSQVMLPSVSLLQPPHKNRGYFIKSLALVVLTGGISLLAFSIAPRQIVHVLMGANYTAYASLLPRLSLAMFLLSVVNLIISYYLALRRYQICTIIGLSIAAFGWLMYANHSSLHAVVDNMVYGNVVMLTVFAIWRAIRLLNNRSLVKDV